MVMLVWKIFSKQRLNPRFWSMNLFWKDEKWILRRTVSNSNRNKPTESIVHKHNDSKEQKRDKKYQEKKRWFSWPGLLIRWVPISVCFLVFEWKYQQYKCDKNELPRTASKFQTILYCSLPLRLISRCLGWLANIPVPVNLRPFIFGFYSKTFKVNLDEAAVPDFKYYSSMSEFFTRPLKDGIRLIDEKSHLVSPCDGRILHIGVVSKSVIEQVKGISYKIDTFLGPNSWCGTNESKGGLYGNMNNYKNNESSDLYECIIYLAPGDYHRFHSPTDWNPILRRHFPGELLSVNPKIAEWFPGLFCINERVVFVGVWQYGFFSYTAVGATNVGSVKIFSDEKLKTNQWLGLSSINKYQYNDLTITNEKFVKGELIGQFNMGSTIVLLFEAPKNFQFNVDAGQRVLVGESIGEFTE